MPSPAGSRSALAAATESGLVAQDRVVSADGELMAALFKFPLHRPGASRVVAAVGGAGLVAVFLQTVVRHPAEGWPAAIALGVPMVWLIQFARSGSAQQLGSVLWYAAWYAVFSLAWLGGCSVQQTPAGEPLGPQASIGAFLGSVAVVGGASRAHYWRLRIRWRGGASRGASSDLERVP